MIKKLKIISVIIPALFLLFFALSAVSFAEVIPQNTNNKSYWSSADNAYIYPNCSPKIEPVTLLDVKWKIAPKNTTGDSTCQVSCSHPEVNGITGCGLLNTVGQDNTLSFDANPQTPLPYYGNGLKIAGAKIGYTYTVSCFGTTETAKIMVKDCEQCEVPFGTIISGLFEKGQVTPISESNLYNWSGFDSFDLTNLSSNLGSGDRDDILGEIKKAQAVWGVYWRTPYDPYVVARDEERVWFKKMENMVNSGYPVLLNYFIFDPRVPGSAFHLGEASMHVVIALRVIDKGVNTYDVEVWDPNRIGTKTLSCVYGSFVPNTSYPNFQAEVAGTYCHDPDNGSWNGMVLLAADESLYRTTLKLRKTYEDYCKSNGLTQYCVVRRGGISRFLENKINQLSFINTSSQTGDLTGGLCDAMTSFVLNVAYLGDFGKDYHPNDGKIVGIDCDNNHQPLYPDRLSVSPLFQNQLASVSFFGNLFSNIVYFLNKLKPSF